MEMTRRQFVVTTTSAAAACAACACAAGDASAADAPATPPAAGGTTFDVGTADLFPKDGTVFDKFAAKPNLFFVVRDGGKLYAPSSKCTHKACAVKHKAGALACPCHDSSFDLMGIPKGGPAKTSLIRYAITQSADGKITVDKSKQFDEKQWDDPAAFVKVT
jgi:nitrite reductase/ring-hydroxylating ferredoxin subunit